jgi:hypothetical protein
MEKYSVLGCAWGSIESAAACSDGRLWLRIGFPCARTNCAPNNKTVIRNLIFFMDSTPGNLRRLSLAV